MVSLRIGGSSQENQLNQLHAQDLNSPRLPNILSRASPRIEQSTRRKRSHQSPLFLCQGRRENLCHSVVKQGTDESIQKNLCLRLLHTSQTGRIQGQEACPLQASLH